ncbi:sporulation protein YpjB [Ornithinibacillus californiensis]|uniref:sporulation protein YpjB n=1 Tax=Ornithinibacillus californiensis TaxID=161536 RepID=UPI00064DEC89|nr:sporulation protein YpjB [Ornithinibacillus californiensis]
MKTRTLKALLWLIIGILVYLLMGLLFDEEVIAIELGEKGNDEMFPFYWLIIIVGGLIACTLSYVSWRKYKGEKQKKVEDNDKSID